MRFSSSLALLIGLIMTLLIAPAPATARTEDGPLAGAGHTVSMPRTGRDWYGAYRLGQTTAYCADLMSAPPRRASTWSEAPAGAPLIKQVGLASEGHLAHGNGAAVVSAEESADIAWVLTHTGPSPSPDTGAAVEHFVRVRTISGAEQTARESARWSAVARSHPGAAAEFERLTQAAAREAGPYTAHLEWAQRPTLEDPAGRVTASVRSRSGQALPGVAVTVRGTGALSVVAASASTGEDGSAPIDVAMAPPGVDPVAGELEVTFSGLAGPAPRVFVPAERTVQRLLVAPARTEITAAATATLEPRFTPEVSTRTRDVVALTGEAAVDIVTLSGGRPGAAFEGGSTLYGPFDSLDALAAATPDDAPRVGSVAFSGRYGADGSAEVHSAELTFPGPGYYTWVESLEPAEFVTPPPPPVWPQPAETSIVLAPAISTELAPHGSAKAGADASDTVRITGIPGIVVPDSSELVVRVSGRLLGPVRAVPADGAATCEGVDWSGAAVVATYEDLNVPRAATRFELAGLAQSRLTEPGCYSAEATVTITHPSRGPIVVRHAVGHPSQTVLVSEAPAPEPSPTPSPASPEPTTQTPAPAPSARVIATPVPGRPGLPSTGD